MNTLHKQTWAYFLVFSLSILAVLWLTQGIFFDKYYEVYKSKQLANSASKIAYSYGSIEFYDYLDSLVQEQEICVSIEKSGVPLYHSNSFNRGCISDLEHGSYKIDFEESGEEKKTYKLVNSKFDNDSLVYGLKLDDDVYAYISVSLEPIDSATLLLKRQLIVVSILILALSIIISYYLSRKMAKPIETISKKAGKIASGNFKDSFDSRTNIKEFRELENSLNEMRDEFYQTEELRRDLMANVSHDLKTPLTMIKAYAEMVRDLTYKNKEKRTENLNVIIEESERLNSLVEDILTLSSMQAEGIQLEYSTFSIDKMITSIIEKYSVLLEKEGYHFLYSPKECLVYADVKRTEQVIYNILNNAINYTGDDKQIFLTVIDKEDTVRIEIRDTGKGIKESEKNKIWTKYYHSQKKHKRNRVGTGLGLSIVKNILDGYKLPYGIESVLGQGTTFYFELKKGTLKNK